MKNEFDYLNDVKMDFSLYGEETISEKEIKRMKQNIVNKSKNKTSRKKIYSLAACVAVVAIAGTAFASGFVGNIIKTVSTGYNNFIQTDASAPQELPDGLKGKLFDKNGIALEYVTKDDMQNLYDENGQKIDAQQLEDMYSETLGGEVKTSLAGEYNPDDAEKNYSSIDEAQNNSVFDIKVPEYLPEGYELSRVYTYTSDDGSTSGEYINLEYNNAKGKKITIFERAINEYTRFTSSTDGKIEELTINGCRAALMDENNINWETEDSVSVSIIAHDISKSELVKTAESVQ